MNVLAGGQGWGQPRQIARLTTAGNPACDVAVAFGGILRRDAHVNEIAFNQNHGIDDVLIGANDGKECAVGRRNVDFAVERF